MKKWEVQERTEREAQTEENCQTGVRQSQFAGRGEQFGRTYSQKSFYCDALHFIKMMDTSSFPVPTYSTHILHSPIQIIDLVCQIALARKLAGEAAHKGPRGGTLYAPLAPIVEVPDEKDVAKAKQRCYQQQYNSKQCQHHCELFESAAATKLISCCAGPNCAQLELLW